MKSILQTVIEDAGYDTRSYSGRGMYGKDCLGVTINPREIGNLIGDIIVAALELGEESGSIADDVRGWTMDSMGYDSIVYFPDVSFEGERK